jgi:hypothetical protein
MRALPPTTSPRRTAMVRRQVTQAGLRLLTLAYDVPGRYTSCNTDLPVNDRSAVKKLERDGMLDQGYPTRRGLDVLRTANIAMIPSRQVDPKAVAAIRRRQ